MIVLGQESYLKPSGNKNYFVHSPSKHCLFSSHVFVPTFIHLLELFLEAIICDFLQCSLQSHLNIHCIFGSEASCSECAIHWKGNLHDTRLGEYGGWGGISMP